MKTTLKLSTGKEIELTEQELKELKEYFNNTIVPIPGLYHYNIPQPIALTPSEYEHYVGTCKSGQQ